MASDELIEREPQVPKKNGKKTLLFWLVFVVVSLPLVFFGTFFFIMLVEKPVNVSNNQINPDSLAISLADSIAQVKADSIIAALDTSVMDSMDNLMGMNIQQESSGPNFALEAAELTAGQQQMPAVTNQTDYKQLAKIYSQMESNAAAKIMSKLDDAMVVGILQEMRDRNAADLMTAFDPDRAARLSEQLSLVQTSN